MITGQRGGLGPEPVLGRGERRVIACTVKPVERLLTPHGDG